MAKEKIEINLADDPDPLPKVGDTINHVGPGRKIKAARVIAVSDDGRTATIEVIGEKTKTVIHLPHRPKELLAGNTWHWPSKAAALLLAFAVTALAITALTQLAGAAIPTYHQASAFGNAAGPATLILPADPNSQIRVVTVLYTSDTNLAQLLFSSGSTAYSLTVSNAATSSITNLIDSTNGLNTGSILVLQHGSGDYTNDVVSWGTYISGTNTFGQVTNQAFVVTASGGFGVYGYVGDEIYLMTSPVPWYVGAGTNVLSGDDVFSGNYGRPVQVSFNTALVTDRLNNITAHYDSASQP
jgi:hypothetical protein